MISHNQTYRAYMLFYHEHATTSPPLSHQNHRPLTTTSLMGHGIDWAQPGGSHMGSLTYLPPYVGWSCGHQNAHVGWKSYLSWPADDELTARSSAGAVGWNTLGCSKQETQVLRSSSLRVPKHPGGTSHA